MNLRNKVSKSDYQIKVSPKIYPTNSLGEEFPCYIYDKLQMYISSFECLISFSFNLAKN